MERNPIYTNPYRHPEDTGLHVMGREISVGMSGLEDTPGLPIGAAPKNAIPLRSGVTVTTAFNAGTTNDLTVGTTGDADGVITAANSAAGTAGANKAGTGALLGTPLATDTVFYANYAQTGTAATAGTAIAWVEFYIPRTEDPRDRAGH